MEWWCPTRFDAPSVFARLLDDDAGHFSLSPDDVVEVDRRYLDGSLVLCTTFRSRTGTVELTDALAMAQDTNGHALGTDSPHVVLRLATCTEGEVRVEVSFAPRFEYGLTLPLMRRVDGGYVARGGADVVRLSTAADLDILEAEVRGHVRLVAGQSIAFALAHGSAWQKLPERWSQETIAHRLDATAAAWRSWEGAHQRYAGPYKYLVTFGGKVLQGLTYQPTGAMVAAATTSLPEAVGGTRNWDYRYAWVRDAAFTLDAMWVAACPSEAGAFLNYLTTAASSVHHRDQLQIMFAVGGERNLSERTLDHLDGWRGSRPVRVGNGAWQQRQVDVYGELLDAVYRLRDQIGPLHGAERRFLATLADRAASAWTEPGHGLWEVRGEPRHYLYSKVMCWVALDRAIALADRLDAGKRVQEWEQVRSDIRDTILSRGWNNDIGAFTRTLDGDQLDASSLTIPLVGFLPADDDRVLATIDATQRTLTDPSTGLVYRYRHHDGLPGDEGVFLLCTFWLADALARSGQVERARDIFDRAAGFANDVGLLAEEVQPGTGELIGNFPQAFSHIGLINAAWAIAQAEQGDAASTKTGNSSPTGSNGFQ